MLTDISLGRIPVSRIEKLLGLLEADPQDVFLHYALATEWVKAGDTPAANERFAMLHTQFPDYVPAWFRHAQWAAETGETDEARRLAEIGLATAKRVGDHHAAGELAGFLELL
jgi:predicted Zn-dependent protease